MTQQPGEQWARPAPDGAQPQPTLPVDESDQPAAPPPLPQASPLPMAPPGRPVIGGSATAPPAAAPFDPSFTPTAPIPTDAPGPVGPAGPAPVGSPAAARSTAARRGAGAKLLGALSLALTAGLLGGIGGTYLLARTGVVTVTQTSARSGSSGPRVTLPTAPAVRRSPGTVAAVAAAVLPSVVQIEITASEGQGSGSGFLIDDEGHVLTNNHVVSAADDPTLTVVFEDGSQQKATVVGKDASYDLAVLKVNTGGRKPLLFGDSDAAVVGDPVIAIGAPLGLQSTVTTGIVSAKNRPVSAGDSQAETSYMNAIQTDAAINPGNSGGPLVDLTGAVIGVNSAIARAPGPLGSNNGNIGLGFAIPSNQAKRIAEMLISKGVAEHPIIGVGLDGRYTGQGVKVLEQATGDQAPVVPGGPADKAGIRPGDVIVAIDGRPVTTSVELIVAIRAKAVGDTAKLTVRRGGKDLTLTVTLVAAPKTG